MGRPSPTTAKREMVPKFLKKSRFFSVNPAGHLLASVVADQLTVQATVFTMQHCGALQQQLLY